MKCPKCSDAKCSYNQRKLEKVIGQKIEFKRTDFSAKCKLCGWEGIC